MKKILGPPGNRKRLAYFRGGQIPGQTAQTCGEMPSHAVRLREDEQTSPIRAPEQTSKPLRIVRWRSALEQRGPFILVRSNAGWMRRGYRLGHSDSKVGEAVGQRNSRDKL